jgi:FkbM family methyltransferase
MAHSAPFIDKVLGAMRKRGLRGTDLVRRALSHAISVKEIIATTAYGTQFELNLTDYIDSIVLREGYYESEVLEACLVNLPHGATFWDVGANFGLHSITLKKIRPDVRVIAIEPSPEMGGRTIRNAALNGVEIELLNLGLGDAESVATLNRVQGNPGMTSFTKWDGAEYIAGVSSYITTGDILIARGVVSAPNTIKLDIEGLEAPALNGMMKALQGSVQRVIFEGGKESADLVTAFGFTVTKLTRSENTEHVLSNYIGVKSGLEHFSS